MRVDWVTLDQKRPEKQTWYAITLDGITGPRISSAYWDGKRFMKGGIEMDAFVHAWADGLEVYEGGESDGQML